jgi:cysteine desulfurase/selenocysteine lyase
MDFKDTFFKTCVFPCIEKITSTQCWSKARSTVRHHHAGYSNQRIAETKLQAVLAVAKALPYWQSLNIPNVVPTNHENNISELLGLMPISTKSDFIQHYPEGLVTNGKKSEHQVLSSGGTSERMAVTTDFNKRDHLRKLENINIELTHKHLSARKTLDIPPSSCNVTCGLEDKGPEDILPFLWWASKNKQWRHASTAGDLRGRLERQWLMRRETTAPFLPGDWEYLCGQIDPILSKIQKERFEVLRGYPWFLYWIALRADEKGMRLPDLKVVVPYGGLAGDVMANRIASILHVQFINLYGTGEVGSVGAGTCDNGLVDVYQHDVVIELFDDNHVPILDEGIPGHVVVTDLNNLAMPIIRYKIGDVGKWVKTNGVQRLLILGRACETMTDIAGNDIYTRDIQNAILSEEFKVLNFQFKQDGQGAHSLELVSDTPIDPYRLKEYFRSNFPKLTISHKKYITPAPSGKYLSFIKETSNVEQGNIAVIREDHVDITFPLKQRLTPSGQPVIYLDNAATAPKPQVVIDAVLNVLNNCTGNVHRGAHFLSDEATDLFEEARANIARFIHANPSDIILLRNTTECINFIAQQDESVPFVTSKAEHHANYLPYKNRTLLPIKVDGTPDLDKLDGLLLKHPNATIALAHIGNVTGHLLDLDLVKRIARKHQARILLDAAQSAAHIPLDIRQLGVDYLVFSGHKIGGPSGVGVLWVNPNITHELKPIQLGGSMVKTVNDDSLILKERPWCFEAGTPNIEGVVGLGVAAALLTNMGMDTVAKRVHHINSYARKKLSRINGLVLIGPPDAIGPISFDVGEANPNLIAKILSERYGICVRAGLHCAEPLHNALNIKGSLRISPWLINDKKDIDTLYNALCKII